MARPRFFSAAIRRLRRWPMVKKIRFRVSPLWLRIMAINSLSVLIVFIGLLYLGYFQDRQLRMGLAALQTEARLFSSAVAIGAVVQNNTTPTLDTYQADLMVRRLIGTTGTRGRIFNSDGQMVADTSRAIAPSGGLGPLVDVTQLATTDRLDHVVTFIRRITSANMQQGDLPVFYDAGSDIIVAFPDANAALYKGDQRGTIWSTQTGTTMFTAAAPIQRDNRIVGVVLLSRDTTEIDRAVRQERFGALLVMLCGLLATFGLSLYLTREIASPLRQLADAADRIHRLHGRHFPLPDFGNRRDEIGDLTRSFQAMTKALWQRMDGVDRFAADVSHELKNPLTSLRSAVETMRRVDNEAARRRLLAIIQDDVQRLDRLISDIAAASRLDAELSRAVPQPINVASLLRQTIRSYRVLYGNDQDMPLFHFILHMEKPGSLHVMGIASRLQQVVQNTLDNAVSFAPEHSVIIVKAVIKSDQIEITISDQGPGIAPDKLDKIFERFYSDRPVTARATNHSGLGLNISQQIIMAMGGQMWAENRLNPDGVVMGARFHLVLPRADGV